MELYVINVLMVWLPYLAFLTFLAAIIYYSPTFLPRVFKEVKERKFKKEVFYLYIGASLIMLLLSIIQPFATPKNVVEKNRLKIPEQKTLEIIPVPSIMEKAKENHSFEDSLWEGVRN